MPMPRPLLALLACLAIAVALPAAAQDAGSGLRADRGSGATGLWRPEPGQRTVGLSLGQSSYRIGCGGGAFACDDSDRSVHAYLRSMHSERWGAELGLVDMGRMDRGGGSTRAQGINLSLVGNAPMGHGFNLYGKLGTTYGRTRVSSDAASPVVGGRESGFGLAYGAGVSYDFTPRLSAVLAWDSHDFNFPGGEREPVRATSLGLQYRY